MPGLTQSLAARTVICHYHVFKTAGTSIEALLRHNYGEGHVSFDGPTSASTVNHAQLIDVIRANPDARSFSSHQISLPVPQVGDVTILPLVLIRHPILRIRSVFLHEMRDRTIDVAEAVKVGFDAWFHELAAGHPNQLQICNLQTNLLCRKADQAPVGHSENGRPLYELDNAIQNLDAVPLLARVEHFDEDVARFAPLIEARGLSFRFNQSPRENVGAHDFAQSTAEQLANFRAQVSEETWDRLFWLNEQDLTLWESVCHRLDGTNHG